MIFLHLISFRLTDIGASLSMSTIVIFVFLHETVFEAAEKEQGDIGDLKLSSAEEREQRKSGEISSNMRDRLLKEAASNDPNFSAGPVAGNPILIISAVVAALVVVGGKGYFY